VYGQRPSQDTGLRNLACHVTVMFCLCGGSASGESACASLGRSIAVQRQVIVQRYLPLYLELLSLLLDLYFDYCVFSMSSAPVVPAKRTRGCCGYVTHRGGNKAEPEN